MDTDTEPVRVRFGARWGVALACIALFGTAASFFAHRALHGEAGLILWRVIELGVGGARVFHGALALASAGFVLMGIVILVRALTTEDYVVIDGDQLVVPGSPFRPAPRVVALSAIRGITEVRFQGQRVLQIHHADGKVEIGTAHVGKKGLAEIERALLEGQTVGGRKRDGTGGAPTQF